MNDVPIPELTAADVTMQLIVAAVYVAVGAAGVAFRPRDERTRVFLALAVMNAIGSSVPTIGWFLGVKNALAFDRVPLAIMLSALSLGALLLFHFSQIFPSRRPWIRGSGLQLPIAYAATPLVVFLMVRWWPESQAQATPQFGLAFLVFGFPLIVLLGLVLPVASIVAFLRSFRDAAATRGLPDPRPAIAGILMSQLAGGALALLVVAPLQAVATESWALAFANFTVWLLSLLTPVAYAAGVWKYGVLEIPIDGSSEMKAE